MSIFSIHKPEQAMLMPKGISCLRACAIWHSAVNLKWHFEWP